MAKSTSKKDTKSVKKAEAPATKPLAVKEGRVTKASQTPKAKSKETAKAVAAKAGKKSKKAKEPTPESSSESESESESEASSSSDSSDSESEVETKKTTKAKASSSDSDSSSESSSDSEAETKPAPKANGIKVEKSSSSSDSDDSSSSDEEEKPAAAKKDDSDSSESSDSDSDSDSEEAPKAKKAEKSSSDSDSESGSDSDSDDSESDSSDESEEKTEAEAPSKKRKAEADAEPVTKKSKTEGASEDGPKSLFVGNLSWNIDEEWLSREFDGFGEIIGCRIVTDKATGRSKGFGYVDFATHEAAKKAKEAKHNQELDGRALNLDFSTPRQNNGNNQDRSQQRADRFGDKTSPPSDTLFVGNISFDATNDMIGEAFGEYGTITRVSLPTDPDSGNPKGFGYVGFSSVDEAKAAFEALQGADIAGRAVRLDYAQPRSNDGGSRGGRGGGRGGARGGRGGGGRGGPRGGARGGRGGFSTNRGGFGDFQGKKITF